MLFEPIINKGFFIDSRSSFRDRKYYFFDIRNHRFENMDTRLAGIGERRSLEMNIETPMPTNMFIGRKNTLEFWKIVGDELRISPTIHPSKVNKNLILMICFILYLPKKSCKFYAK